MDHGRPNRPRHFHLLWSEELDTLRPILELIRERLDDVLSHWHDFYLLHFGDERTLTQGEFRDIFHQGLTRTTNYLLAGDIDSYSAAVIQTGELLAERRVPFSEVIASLHLYEESIYKMLPDPLPLRTYATFDKLSHIRMILLADAYFRSETAVAGARIRALEREAARIARDERRGFHGLVGATPAMRRLYERIEAAAGTRGNVLVVGESGTGKELVARAIHECGPNPPAPFVALNCAAIPKDLIESELFGYKRGAFSGANNEYLGLFRAADGGTLFLDEITEMSAETQSKFLRAVQERKVRPVGATHELAVDVRLIASTNRDPAQAVASSQLRQDLYYRLQASVLEIVPLRKRLDDLPLLTDHFVALFAEKLRPRAPIHGIAKEALAAMSAYAWPGNVRELSNVIESAFTFGRGPMVELEDLPPALRGTESQDQRSPQPSPIGTFADAERELIARALETTNGNKFAAARLLRISRKKLYAKIAKYGLSPCFAAAFAIFVGAATGT
ncbi:MAG: sigma 54-interacting transcriptional regulator [Candidatus Binataceae bacterium]